MKSKAADQTRLEPLAPTRGTNDKTYWRKVGVAFPLKNRSGYSLKLEMIPVPTNGAYEFVLVEPSEKKPNEE